MKRYPFKEQNCDLRQCKTCDYYSNGRYFHVSCYCHDKGNTCNGGAPNMECYKCKSYFNDRCASCTYNGFYKNTNNWDNFFKHDGRKQVKP